MSKPKSNWIDLTEILTPKGVEALKAGNARLLPIKVGQVLKFDFEGSPNHLKIMRMDKATGKVWAKETKLYHPDDVKVVDKETKR